MLPVEITVKQASLAATLAAMRVWLDREQCTLSNFRHASDGEGLVLIKADFLDAACAQRFRLRFGGTA